MKMISKKIIETQNELLKNINIENQYERLAQNVTPYWQLSYEEELEIKQKKCEEFVINILNKISTNKVNTHKKLQQIIPSPVREAYRNKDELSAWCGVDNVAKTVGLLVGRVVAGRVICVPVTRVPSIKQSHKEIGQVYQELIRSSDLPAGHQLFDGTFWREITIRSNDTSDHSVVIVTNPLGLTEAERRDQEEAMRRHFRLFDPSISLFHQSCPHVKCTRQQAEIRCLSGNKHLTHLVCGKPFRVSVDSFFPLNSAAAEIMFQEVLQLAQLTHFTTLLDINCGVGTLSVLAHERARGCVGIDSEEHVIEDARYNAATNGATNCRFVAGNIEQSLTTALNRLENSSSVVAVVNPGRSGANESVISVLRRNSLVKRLVYVTRCSSTDGDNPLALKNFIQLCERVSPSSRPFHLVQASPVDICPLTNRCDIILRFDKI